MFPDILHRLLLDGEKKMFSYESVASRTNAGLIWCYLWSPGNFLLSEDENDNNNT